MKCRWDGGCALVSHRAGGAEKVFTGNRGALLSLNVRYFDSMETLKSRPRTMNEYLMRVSMVFRHSLVGRIIPASMNSLLKNDRAKNVFGFARDGQ